MSANPEQIAARSEELFAQGLCCAESVLQAAAESRGIKSELIPRIATGLCGGLSRTGDLCGAVSGGVLAINMIHGRTDPAQTVESNFRLIRDFVSAFEAKFGSTNCPKLIGCRLDTPEGQQFFKANNLREKCRVFTREAARMAGEALESA